MPIVLRSVGARDRSTCAEVNGSEAARVRDKNRRCVTVRYGAPALKLLGFAVAGAPGPVTEGYLPLGELTAVIGANDAGKSRMVRTFSRAFASDLSLEAGRTQFIVELDLAEADLLLNAIDQWTEGVNPYATDVAQSKDPPQVDMVAWTSAAVADIYDEQAAPGWLLVHRAMCDSGYFSLAVEAETDGPRAVITWCMPPSNSRAPALQEALETFLAAALGENPVLIGADIAALATGVIDDPAPVELIRLGTAPISILPAPVAVPASDSDIADVATSGYLS